MNATDKSLLSHRPFLFLWTAQVFSQTALRLGQFALGWWIMGHAGTRGGTWLAVLLVSAALPSILFVKFIGKLVDSTTMKPIALISGSVNFLAFLFGAALLRESAPGEASVLVLGTLVLTSIFLGGAQALFDPALNKAIPQTVPSEALTRALSLQTSTQSMANFGGALLAAALLVRLPVTSVLTIAAACYLPSMAFAVLSQRFLTQAAAQPQERLESPAQATALISENDTDLEPLLRKLLVGFGIVNFFATPVLILMPLYVTKVLKGSAGLLGTIEGSLWIGLVIGAFAARWIPSTFDAVKVASSLLVVFAVALGLPSLFIGAVPYGVFLFFAGGALGLINARMMVLFQSLVPPERKGKFFATLQALIGSLFPISYLAFGFLSDHVPIPLLCAVQGVGVAFAALYIYSLASEDLRDARA